MASVVGFKGNLNYGAVPYGPAGVVDLNPSFEKTKKATGYNKFEPFEEGIKKTLESLKGEKLK
jgi:nucleoside-diphosphate-sugar epimerase